MSDLDEIARAVQQQRRRIVYHGPRFWPIVGRLLFLLLLAGLLTVGLMIPDLYRLTMDVIYVLLAIFIITEGVKIGVRAAMKNRR